MTEDDAIQFFLRNNINAAREMSIPDSRAHIRGLLLMAGDKANLEAIRKIYALICTCDEQLELFNGDKAE